MEKSEYEPPAKRTRKSVKDQKVELERNAHYKPGEVSVDCLGEDVLVLIFGYVDIKTVFRIQRVSTGWNKVFHKYCKLIREFPGRRFPFRQPKNVISIIKHCPNLITLDLSPFADTPKSFSKVAHETNFLLMSNHLKQIAEFCPNIRNLILSGLQIKISAIKKIQLFTELQTLDLAAVKFRQGSSGDCVSVLSDTLSHLRGLKILNVSGTNNGWTGVFSGNCLKGVNRDTLESLNISLRSYIWRPVAQDVIFGTEWPALKDLKAASFSFPNDDVFGDLVKWMPNLVSLDLTNATGRKQGIESLAALPNLEMLYFGNYNIPVTTSSTLEDKKALVETLLAALTDETSSLCRGKLKVLDLMGNSMNEETVKMIAQLPNLTELLLSSKMDRVGGWSDHQESLLSDHLVGIVVAGCRKMERLTLRGFHEITDAALASIGSYCSQLTYLDIVGCVKVFSEGLKCLSEGLKASDSRPQSLKLEVLVKGCGGGGPPLDLEPYWDLMTVNTQNAPEIHSHIPQHMIPVGNPWEGRLLAMNEYDSDSDSDDFGEPWLGGYGWNSSDDDWEDEPCHLM